MLGTVTYTFVSDCTANIPTISDSASISYSGDGSAPHASGTIATVTCNSGYTPSGNGQVTCTAGSWGTSPTCDPDGKYDIEYKWLLLLLV